MNHVRSVGMRKTARVALVSLVLAGAGFGVTACQSDPDIDITKLGLETDAPETLYNQGLANMKAGNLAEAGRKFDSIDRQNPFTEWGRKALVMSTFTKYRLGRNDEAVATGNRYMSQYPQSQDSAYVQYLVGLAYSKQIADVTQDQRAAVRTIDAMNKVVTNYPSSEYVEDAQAKIRFARDQLAGKEMQIGRYYLERKEYLAAIQRFRNVVEQYPNTNQVEEALARLTEAYYAMGITEEAQTAAAVLGRNYPDSQWYADSFKLLKGNGVEPRENRGSWISRAGAKLIGA
ncbi:Outer membrane protein assembly factor BamD [Neorhizobium galegae bv. officinalis bv. officinalis str. HAMBI 1141]|jgi:outer membrane protein assembly factor BamD|uniref:Outer membrane protein assembly factor BamD n=3 Tax=Rhizobium/Agrobacterium group TaxID=227290 RepID=A0A6A1TR54_NEOGA|nr:MULTISPECIES: outer membrane protein assembly factor BamD [Neorhizobium]KAB1087062.1 outer membrane protein assembly factor BamD [Neorhizobium galegae]MCJ9754156.1 outer membrane protein assembly factor BamD [Neorhizobium sp. BETTINA12A]MCQ1852377.1 outer membrane protein assembly factor BamD [Neorhizobium galegae]CDN54428.1 Outer membrane protein assembly factor BamD [Neorhizobium galegae bv. officinalis bv. officinalis str. HAMBI 1141]